MPGRKYAAGASAKYRFSINGQEKETEVNENITTALYWEYDSRIVRRWNVDPKPNVSISPYNCFADNPIFYSDNKGDTLNIPESGEAARKHSESDIKSLIINPANLKYIKVGEDGNITLTGSKLEMRSVANNDMGFNLVYNLVTAENHFFYEASESSPSREMNMKTKVLGSISRQDLTKSYPEGSVISHDATKRTNLNTKGVSIETSDINMTISNFSITPRGDEIGPNQTIPSRSYVSGGETKRFDGYVAIAPGEFYNMSGTTKIMVSRASIVFHELQENFFRTFFHLPYDDAHPAAQEVESAPTGENYGNSSPGTTPSFFFFKK